MKQFIFLLLTILFWGCTEEEKEVIKLLDLQLNEENVTLKVGESFQFKAITIPSDFPVEKYDWNVVSRDGNGNGTITNNGLFTATNPGSVIVGVETPELMNGKMPFFANTIVIIKSDNDHDNSEEKVEIEDINFNNSHINIKKGESIYIDYKVYPQNADVSKIKWEVSDNSIITINSISNNRIQINALKIGESEIYTVINEKKFSCRITVESVSIERIEITPKEKTLKQGESITIKTTIFPSDAEDTELEFTSSDKSIAIVSQTGVVTALKPGICTITVSTKDKSIKDDCKITVSETSIEDLIDIDAGVSVKLYNNGYLTGKLKAKLINHSDKRIKLTKFLMHDTKTYQIGEIKFEEKYIEPFDYFSMTLEFNNVYKPVFEWDLEYNGESFSKTYVSVY